MHCRPRFTPRSIGTGYWKEYLVGFWIIEAPDLDVALQLATQGSQACNRKVELRPFLAG